MRILFLGDVVGCAGREALVNALPELRVRLKLDCVIVNGENAAGGYGITEEMTRDLIECGVDAVTLGNHAWDQREALIFINRTPRLLRPLNAPPGTPGRGATVVQLQDRAKILVMTVMGRAFMQPILDDPVQALERELALCRLGDHVDAIVVEVHCEATSEKQCVGLLLDGRVSMVVGTHTHAPTADARILSGGTAFQTDVGMCGNYAGVLGFEGAEPVRRYVTALPASRWRALRSEGTLAGLVVETDEATGLARRVSRLCVGPLLENVLPDWDA